MQIPGALLGRLAIEPDHNPASGGELDGVVAQVGQDLAQATRVGAHLARQRCAEFERQRQPFLRGARAQRLQGVAHQARQIEDNRLNVQPAGFNLGKIKNVVQDDHERLGRRLDHLQILPLHLVQVGVQGQVRHTDHAIHGGSDFVAHIGQKLTLGAVGGLGMAGGPAQRQLHLRTLGDVDNVGDQAGDFAGRIGDRRLAKQALARLAGLPVDEAGLEGLSHAGLKQLLVTLRVDQQGVITHQLCWIAAHPLRALHPEQILECPIHPNKATLAVFQIQGCRRRLQQHLDKAQLVFQLGLNFLAFADVGPNRDVLGRPAVGPEQRHDGGTHPVLPPILVPVLDFATPNLALLNGLPQLLEKHRRVETAIDDPVVHAQQFFTRKPADGAEPVIGIGDVALGVGDADNGMLVQCELLVGKLQPPLLTLPHQGHHLVHQRVEVVRRLRLGARGRRLLEGAEHPAQRLERALAGVKLVAQATVQALLLGHIPKGQHKAGGFPAQCWQGRQAGLQNGATAVGLRQANLVRSPIGRRLPDKKGRRQQGAEILPDEGLVITPQQAQGGRVDVAHPVVGVGGQHPIVDGAQSHAGFGALVRELAGRPVENVKGAANLLWRVVVEQRIDRDLPGQDLGLVQTHPVKVTQPAPQGHLDQRRAQQQHRHRCPQRCQHQPPEFSRHHIMGKGQAQHTVIFAAHPNHLIHMPQLFPHRRDQPAGRGNLVDVLMAGLEHATPGVDELSVFQRGGIDDPLQGSVDGVVIANDRAVTHRQRCHFQRHPAVFKLAVNLPGKLVTVKQA